MPGNRARSPKRTAALRQRLARRSGATRTSRCAALVRLPGRARRALAALALLVACVPTPASPEQLGAARDERDALRVAAQLGRMPEVRRAHVTLSRAVADPLRGVAAAPATSSVVLVIERGVEPARLSADARALVQAVAPEIDASRITVIARPEPAPPPWVQVGPFAVAPHSRRPLQIAALAVLALCAALGVLLAARERRRARDGDASGR